MLLALSDHWPRGLSVTDLLRQAGDASSADIDAILRLLASCVLLGIVQLRTEKEDFVTVITARPNTSDFARYQAHNTDLNWVCNQFGEAVILDPLSKSLLGYLDGARRHVDLLKLLPDIMQQTGASITLDGEAVRDPAKLKAILEPNLARMLKYFAESALLVA